VNSASHHDLTDSVLGQRHLPCRLLRQRCLLWRYCPRGSRSRLALHLFFTHILYPTKHCPLLILQLLKLLIKLLISLPQHLLTILHSSCNSILLPSICSYCVARCCSCMVVRIFLGSLTSSCSRCRQRRTCRSTSCSLLLCRFHCSRPSSSAGDHCCSDVGSWSACSAA
jgi:hypothetical protein